MSDAMAGTTFPDVPASPEREIRRNHAKALRDRGRSLGEIANILNVPRWTVQDDLRSVPKPSPLSVRFPADVLEQARQAAERKGVTVSQFVVDSVRQRLAHQDRNRELMAEKRAARRDGGAGDETSA